MAPPSVQAGELTLTAVSDGTYLLDGGAMFGIIPKPLWEKVVPVDPRNRIMLGLNCLLIRGGGRTVLVDTGMGTKWDAKECERYGIDHSRHELVRSLAEVGVSPEQVDTVVCTHLHFDHVGGNTMLDGQGDAVPTFPNATYWTRRDEWEWATHPNERTAGSYRSENFLPIHEAGQLRFSEGDWEVLPGVRTWWVGGHAPFLDLVRIDAGGLTAVYLADLIPMAAHVPLPWIMGYDLDPVTTLQRKKQIEPQAAEQGWLLIFEHDDAMPLARLVSEAAGRYRAVAWS